MAPSIPLAIAMVVGLREIPAEEPAMSEAGAWEYPFGDSGKLPGSVG